MRRQIKIKIMIKIKRERERVYSQLHRYLFVEVP